jgi:hypothetical protein
MGFPPIDPGVGPAVWTHFAFNRFNKGKSNSFLFLAGMAANGAFLTTPGSGSVPIRGHWFLGHFTKFLGLPG